MNDEEQYKTLRDKEMSKEKTARSDISGKMPLKRGKHTGTKDELRNQTEKIGIESRPETNKKNRSLFF